MYHLITVGDTLIDTHIQVDNASVKCDLNDKNCQLCLDYASKVPITGSFQALGGNAANVACGAAKLGLSTGILTSVGDDANGKLAVSELKKYGVGTAFVALDKKTKTRYSVILNFRGERTILSFHARRNYAWPKKFPETDWIYYTGLSEGFEPLQEKLLKFLDSHGSVRTAMNPGSYQLKNALDKVREFLPHADILIVNLEEAQTILNTTLEKEKTVSTLINKLCALGAKEVAITDAGKGAWAGNDGEVWHTDTFPVEVVAKTGAGDAFSSGYLAARFYGHDISTALQWGIANSCGVIGQWGAQTGLLDKNGVEAMIKRYADVIPKKI